MKRLLLSVALLSTSAFATRPIPENERIAPLIKGQREVTSLNNMDKMGLNVGETSIDLWSGSYWPMYQGFLASRYRDSNFITLINDKSQFDKFKELQEKLPLYTYSGKENLLSPAEKYDLLVGDKEMGLTKYSLKMGDDNMKLSGKVPTWRGICDGWASASQMMPRPTKSVVMKTPSGLELTFFPEDIKALGSLLYSRAQENVIFLGKRCSGFMGQLNGGCNGTNPGAFHKALVNRVGAMKKTFIADVSATSEVWNYPVKSYKISYWNVFTEKDYPTAKGAMELFTKKNQFRKPGRRDDKTYGIVGVTAVVTYRDMRAANLLEADSKEQDLDLVKTYNYDLEVDYSTNVLGGEWYGNMPDFIWAPNDLTYPLSNAEELSTPKTPAQITKAAQLSSKEGQPLAMIVKQLFESSK